MDSVDSVGYTEKEQADLDGSVLACQEISDIFKAAPKADVEQSRPPIPSVCL